MFRSKKDVDRHVQEVLRKVKSEHERNLRCYNIAQQYYKVRDYESAKNYLSLYLSVKEDSPLAHKLQGQIWEGLGDKTRALGAYKTSLEYEANQPDLVLKMCELLCETDVAMDTDRAHYWCERGSDLFPHDPAVFRLKEKLLQLGGKANSQAFEDLINSEVKARPSDVCVRTRLMRLYLETGRTRAAFTHAVELDAYQTFRKELVWYQCFTEVCQAYADEFPGQMDWQFYCTWVSVLDRLAGFLLSELSAPNKLIDCVEAIFSLDQVLFKAASVTPPKDHVELYKQFMRHMTAQLCLHIATLILKRAKKEPSNWREATRAVSIVLFLALSPPPDTEVGLTLKGPLKQSLALWVSDAYYRVSQAGYTLLALSKDAGNQFTEKVTHMATGNWRERTFQRIFTVLDHRVRISTSHFVHSELLAKLSVRLPTHDSGVLRTRLLVPIYEKVRETLHHLVWLGLETAKHNDDKLPPDFHSHSFTRLKLTTHNLANMSPETLSVLDVDAFLYATVLCAAATQQAELLSGFYSSDRPVTLPADISNLLCTQDQVNWWDSARQVNSQQFSSNTNLVVLRQLLQRGLEVVRVDGKHGLEVQLIVKLARTFADRAASVADRSAEQTALEQRASLYWNAALPLLEKMERNQPFRASASKLFEYPRKELSTAEVCSLLEEGRYFIACQLMKCEEYERAIEAFKPLRSPYASFNQALIYKKLAAAEVEDRPREEITSEMRSKNVILLSKARECLNTTWERIRIDRQHPLHQTMPEHISEVETALSRIEPDPDMVNRSDGEANISQASLSSLGSPAAGDMGLHVSMAPRLNGHSHRQTSTPRRHHHSHSDHKRFGTNGELVDVGQLLQIQTLHDELKKVHEKVDSNNVKIYEKLEMIIDHINELRRDMNKVKPSTTEDLYILGDEEEYPEDVLSGQYQPTFIPSYPATPQPAATFYPQPTRGVQGTSTVTYGAPPAQTPVIPLIPMRVPLDPTLAAYQAPQNLAFYSQGGLPFTEPQHLPDFLRQTIPKQIIPQQPPPPPVNVVITTSDTLPTGPPPIQPTLSVTIPPQHRLGTLPISTPSTATTVSTQQTTVVLTSTTSTPPHKFQIPMPATATTPTFEKSPIVIPDDVDSDDEPEIEHDPCPDFRPIIPLPNEVNVLTGEEDDDILFENRAKLFRFVEKEWKERGVGVVKILRNRASGKVRLLMRRDQVHKVCANHLLKSDMELTMLKNSDRALIWVANDFAEEVVQLEKFCIKFKTTEEAMKFKDVFNDAKVKYGQSPQKPTNDKESKQADKASVTNKDVKSTEKSSVAVKDKKASSAAATENKPAESTVKVNVGGFTFTSPPKLKEPIAEKAKPQDEKKKEVQPTQSPFAAFTFKPQKPSAPEPTTKSNILKQPVLGSPLFAGLNSTQNKHTLFEDTRETSPVHNTTSQKDSSYNVPKETSPKTLLKQPILPSVQPVTVTPNLKPDNNTKEAPKSAASESATQPKPIFSFTYQATNSIKETPKSILKDSPTTNSLYVASPPVSTPKAQPQAKHVLFQDSVSPSQQTPTLAALLTAPKTPVMDFAALSKINENKTPQFSSEKKSGGFEGAGSMVFGGSRARNDSEGDHVEEFVPSAEFKPVIPLPDLVEVKTGEEGQEVLFDERAKLMRFDPDNKEWKERGLGQMKILKDPGTGITRFLMRRAQVFKVCCNHRIIQSLELKASPSSEKAWTWYAVDYSEGEMKNELFAIRFKNLDQAKKFKETVDKVQKQLREETTSKRSCPDSNPQEEAAVLSNVWKCQNCLFPNSSESPSCKGCSKTKSEANALPKLSDLFRPKTGSWECKACYSVNGIKDSSCVCCDTPKEKPKSPGPSATSSPAAPEKTTTQGPSLAEMFKPKAGSWECGGCLVRNDGDKTVCPACSTPKPGHENDAKDTSKSSGSNSFSFGIKPLGGDKGTGFSFGIKPSEDTTKSSFTFGIKQSENNIKVDPITNPPASLKKELSENLDSGKSASNTTSGFTFGQMPSAKTASPFTFTPKADVVSSSADSTTPSSTSEAKPKFKFENLFGEASTPTSKPSYTFGTPSSLTISTEEGEDQFAFGKGGKFEFNFSGVKPSRSPSGSKSPRSPGGQETDSEPEDVEEEADHIVFQPVVPLPDKVPVTTGEESEVALYSHRAKLYRFAQGEWKERGVGDIKILRHNDTNKIRLLMRREPILKICLNHYLAAEMVFSPKDDKSWLWCAQDYADGQLTSEQFCLRLKTPEIAADFKAAVDSAQGELEAARSESQQDVGAAAATHDVEIVYEVKVSDELRDAALRLELPPNFYSYLDAAPCPGCAGCEPDSEGEEAAKPQPTKPPVPTSKSTVVSTAVSQPFTFAVQTTTASTPVASTTVTQPFTFSVKTTTASTPVASTTVSQPFTFSVQTTTASSVASTTVSQPFTFSVQTTTANKATPSILDATTSAQPFTFTTPSVFATATTASQPFTFSVKTTTTTSTTASSVFGVATSKQSAATTASTPLLPTPTTVQSGFSFSLNTSTTTVSSVEPSKPSLFSSNSVSTPQTTSFFGGAPLFQNQPVSKTMFGSPSVFESAGSTPSTGASLLFGTTASTQSATTLSFGSSQNTTSNLFGGSAPNQTPKGTSLFSSSFASPIFGSSSTQSATSVLFGPTTTAADSDSATKGTSFFNLASFQSPQTTSLFGGASPQSPASGFGTPTTTQLSLFGGGAQTAGGLFSGLGSQTEATPSSAPTFLFKPTTTFSDIAATNQQSSFEPAENKSSGNFAWAGAGTKVFGAKTETKKKAEESGGESDGEEGDADTSHDPVFEPIVPLPDTIEVRTGEEDEEKEFCQRAKFFRYNTDTKEWKERGVGDMKILRHREVNTYRLLLRREQVHKVVCNQLITPELELQSLANSDKAFCWAGMNMAEEDSEPRLEKVAVRFKNSDTAEAFKLKLEECIAIVKARKAAVSENLDSSGEGVEPVVTIEEVTTDYSEGEEADYGDGEYLDEEDGEPMFLKRSTLYRRDKKGNWAKISQGELSIVYSHEMRMGNIVFKRDNGEALMISTGHDSNQRLLGNKEVVWSGIDYEQEDSTPDLHEFKAEFSSTQAAEEFLTVFNELLEISQTNDSYLGSEPDDYVHN